MGSDSGSEGLPIPKNLQEQTIDTNIPQETPKASNIKLLYRGVWMDVIKEGDRIPVGGSIFSDDLDVILEVDSAWMDSKTGNFTRERIDEVFNSGNADKFNKWIADSNTKIDAETLHTLVQVQMKMRTLLKVTDGSVASEREDQYLTKRSAKLSQFVGLSECAEQAVVGKLLLDKIGINSSLMEGVHVDSKNADPNDHVFLILDDPQGEGSLIFDIARPKASLNGYPRILRTNRKFDYQTFDGKKNYVVPAIDIYNGKTLYYGVGHSSLLQDVNFAKE